MALMVSTKTVGTSLTDLESGCKDQGKKKRRIIEEEEGAPSWFVVVKANDGIGTRIR